MSTAPAAAPEDAVRRLRRKALTAIREGRVRVLVAERCWDADFGEWRPSLRILARVKSSHPLVRPHEVRLEGATWTCTCGRREDDWCPHRAAVAMVTGHPGPGTAAEP